MIKVNLLRNMGMAQGGAVSTGSGTETFGPVGDAAKKQAAIKLAVILALPVLLYVYEMMSIGSLREALIAQRNKVQEVQNEKSKYGDTSSRVERYNKEKARIDKELEIVRELARSRLREVKALDALQSLMPNHAWARSILIEGNLVRLSGYTSSEDGIAELIRSLENSAYFSRVEPKSTSQEDMGGTPVKKFDLDFRIGKQE